MSALAQGAFKAFWIMIMYQTAIATAGIIGKQISHSSQPTKMRRPVVQFLVTVFCQRETSQQPGGTAQEEAGMRFLRAVRQYSLANRSFVSHRTPLVISPNVPAAAN